MSSSLDKGSLLGLISLSTCLMDVHVVNLVAHNRDQVTSLRVREPESYPRLAQRLTLQKNPRVLEVWAHFVTMAVFFFCCCRKHTFLSYS